MKHYMLRSCSYLLLNCLYLLSNNNLVKYNDWYLTHYSKEIIIETFISTDKQMCISDDWSQLFFYE